MPRRTGARRGRRRCRTASCRASRSTRTTPTSAGDGAYDAGGDPTIAFSPDGRVAYFVCRAFNFTSPYEIALLLNRSYDGGITWQHTGLTQISTWNGNGKSKGSNGQFPDHENIHVDQATGDIYVTWAQFDGYGTHSPAYVAVSHDGGDTFTTPAKITAGSVRNNQDQRIVTDPNGVAYLTFDNGIQGGKGTALYVSKSTDRGATWSAPVQYGTFVNPVCIFPPYCFNISGGQFRLWGGDLSVAVPQSLWLRSARIRRGHDTDTARIRS